MELFDTFEVLFIFPYKAVAGSFKKRPDFDEWLQRYKRNEMCKGVFCTILCFNVIFRRNALGVLFRAA